MVAVPADAPRACGLRVDRCLGVVAVARCDPFARGQGSPGVGMGAHPRDRAIDRSTVPSSRGTDLASDASEGRVGGGDRRGRCRRCGRDPADRHHGLSDRRPWADAGLRDGATKHAPAVGDRSGGVRRLDTVPSTATLGRTTLVRLTRYAGVDGRSRATFLRCPSSSSAALRTWGRRPPPPPSPNRWDAPSLRSTTSLVDRRRRRSRSNEIPRPGRGRRQSLSGSSSTRGRRSGPRCGRPRARRSRAEEHL